MIASQPSFSYMNNHLTEERFMRKFNKNKVEDNELGIFGAEKYFKGVIDEEHLRTSNNGVHRGSNQPQEKHDKPSPMPKPKTPISIRSESSWNSKRGLLVSNVPNGNNHSKKTSVKSLFASLGCKCTGKGSVKIAKAKEPVKGVELGQNTKPLSSKRADDDVTMKREDCFTFLPVLNPSKPDMKHPKLQEVKQDEATDALGRLPTREYINDTGSDGSSDLFELESFSTNENNLLLAQQETKTNLFLASQETERNTYAPSEASVDWSIATASVLDFPTTENLVIPRNVKGLGILSGCKSVKGVRVSSEEHRKTGGGEKAAVMVSSTRREWCSRLDSTTPVAKIQADTKLICAGPGLHMSQNGFGLAREVHRTHSTHASSRPLYMK